MGPTGGRPRAAAPTGVGRGQAGASAYGVLRSGARTLCRRLGHLTSCPGSRQLGSGPSARPAHASQRSSTLGPSEGISGSSAQCVGGGRRAASPSGAGSVDLRQLVVGGDMQYQVPAHHVLCEAPGPTAGSLRPRTGTRDRGHGTTCPTTPAGVPGPADPHRSHRQPHEPTPAPAPPCPARLPLRRAPPGSRSAVSRGAVGWVRSQADGGQLEAGTCKVDRRCRPQLRPGRPVSGVNASPDLHPGPTPPVELHTGQPGSPRPHIQQNSRITPPTECSPLAYQGRRHRFRGYPLEWSRVPERGQLRRPGAGEGFHFYGVRRWRTPNCVRRRRTASGGGVRRTVSGGGADGDG